MSRLAWYWHRLRAMSPGEMALHLRKKLRQRADARSLPDWSRLDFSHATDFPKLPRSEDAPAALCEALARDVEEILAGRWRAFSHLELRVDDPPRWHKDYLAGVDLTTDESAFQLNHRAPANGADIKLIWELSRWNQLVRLAMAAFVLGDVRAAGKCLDWLEDWVQHHPPYRGWNWTSALESGLRLVQFTWIDALLGAFAAGNPSRNISDCRSLVTSTAGNVEERLNELRRAILPAHVWFTWRHRSFGSSANNHLLGELAGVILATVRWPELAKCGASVEFLHRLWEREVLAQFAEDGGNKEQALSYQLFSFEFCWQTQQALRSAGRAVSNSVDTRLAAAASFFWNVQWNGGLWPYGDSDDAYVTPLFTSEHQRVREWRDWVAFKLSPSLTYWLGDTPCDQRQIAFGPPANASEYEPWSLYPKSGLAVASSGLWWLRWDLSPLGYLATAAHGHLDALHLSVWFNGEPFIIDPGTGAYYADKELRNWLASREAHNTPCPAAVDFPKRLGSFLWSKHHAPPRFSYSGSAHIGTLDLPGVRIVRRFEAHGENLLSWCVEDSCVLKNGAATEFCVRWQFASGVWVKQVEPRKFVLNRGDTAIGLELNDDWAEVHFVEQPDDRRAPLSPHDGYVSPAFRKVEWAPYLKLVARPKPGQPCVFRTTFLASAPS